MPQYLFQGSYTAAAWAALARKPQNRTRVIQVVVKKLGGELEGFWLTLGEHDFVGLVRMPNSVNAAALSIAAMAGGAIASFKTTALMSVPDGLKAMGLAGRTGYQPPT
jgi:uncharacterized protein with GYD domain